MSKVAIQVNENTAMKLLMKAAAKKISVSSLLDNFASEDFDLSKIRDLEISDSSDSSDSGLRVSAIGSARKSPWVELALDRARALVPGTEFSFGSLLREEWNQMQPKDRNALGNVFKGRLIAESVAEKTGEEWLESGFSAMSKYRRL